MLLLISFLVDVLATDIWQELASLDSPELRKLAEGIQNSVLGTKAPSTTKKYLAAFRHWKQWATSHNIVVFPVKEAFLALYLQSIAETAKSKSAVEEAVNSISWAHQMAGVPSPTASTFVKSTVQGLQRKLARPVVKKLPVTVAMLEAIVDNAEHSGSLTDLRLATACVVGYAAFLRFNELVHIKAEDIKVEEGFMSIQIPQSKTDQLRKGNEVVVSRTGSKLCPVSIIERYMARADIVQSKARYIFRPITKSGQGEKLRESGCLTYSRLQECFKAKLEELGFPSQQYGLHSLCLGGATAAANSGVQDRLFKRHSRWQSETAKDGYVENSLKARLSVTDSLGL